MGLHRRPYSVGALLVIIPITGVVIGVFAGLMMAFSIGVLT
jgi:hypothetical protein